MRPDRFVAIRLGFVWLSIVSAAAVPAFGQNCELFPSRAHAVGNSPTAVAVGDLDGDSNLDLAVANSDSNDVSILLGSGGGEFAKATHFPVAGSPQQIAIADLDGDARLDLAVCLSDSEHVLLLYGDGLGGIAATKSLSMASVPSWLVIHDLNGDAQPDIVVAGPDSVTVRISKGGGAFKAPVTAVVTSGLNAIAIGDLNGDTKPDLALARKAYPLQSIVACFGDGLGGFAAPIEITSAFTGGSAAIGEMTGDAIADLAIGGTGLGEVKILPGLGGGAFGEAETFAIPAFKIAIADFNGDGRGDLVTNHSSYITILASKPFTELFAAPAHFSGGAHPVSIAVGDLNRDGNLDLAVSNQHSDTVTTMFGTGLGGLAGPTKVALDSNPKSIVAADFNADSKVDLAFVSRHFKKVWILLGDSMGGFAAPPKQFSAGGNPQFVGSADFDRDGSLDLAVADHESPKLWILLGDGAGGFGVATSFVSVSKGSNLRTGDFNADEFPDVAVTTWSNNGVAIHLGDGMGGLGPPVVIGVGFNPVSLALGDWNGDGKLDFVTTPKKKLSTGVTVGLGNGAGGFSESVFIEVGTGPKSAQIVDLNGDGKSDIATTHLDTKEVSILWGEGSGTSSQQSSLATGPGPTSLEVADLDGDGLPDLFVMHAQLAAMSVLRGKGSGEFKKPLLFATGLTEGSVAIADLNSDGMLDVSLATPPHGVVPSAMSIFLNRCSNSLCATAAQALSYGSGKPGWFIVPKMTSTPPRLGSTATLSLTYPVPMSGVLLVGLKPLQLPFDGGTLLVEPIAFKPFTFNVAGKAVLPFPIPADAQLCGSNVYFQALFVDPLVSGPFHTAQTDGIHWVIGF